MSPVAVPTWSDVREKYSTLTPMQAVVLVILGTPILLIFVNLIITAVLITSAVMFGAVVLKVIGGIASALTNKKG